MTDPLPKWIQKRYSILWSKFGNNRFSYEDAKKELNDDSGLHVFFSELRKAGWLDVTLNKEDIRKRSYQLKDPLVCFKEMKK